MGSNPTLSAIRPFRAPGAPLPRSSRSSRIPTSRVQVLPDHEAQSRAAAALFARAAAAAVRRRGLFRVALAGGTTPRRMYELLADTGAPWRRRIPWTRVHVFFGDERLVPPGHPDSNFRMARAALLSRVPIPVRSVHRIRGESGDPARAARACTRSLRACFGPRRGAVPRFDLIVLGMGADGHVASLFPGSPVLRERRRLAAAVPPGRGPARVTLTLPLLNAAALVVVLVAGGAKAAMTRRILASGAGSSPAPLPAALLRPKRGRLLWLLDRSAARLLPRSR